MKKCSIAILVLAMTVALSGCGNKSSNEKSDTKESKKEVVINSEENDAKEDNTSNNEVKNKADSENQDEDSNSAFEIRIYKISDTGEGVEPITESIDKLDEKLIWQKLQNLGVITNDCDIVSFDVTEKESGKLVLDVNRSFGDVLRSSGSLGADLLLACVVNTYLDAYACQQMKITEEGKPLETGHGSYDYYMEKTMSGAY